MGNVKKLAFVFVFFVLIFGLVFLFLKEIDFRFPWEKKYYYEIKNSGCLMGIISEDYKSLSLPTGFKSFYLAWGDKFPYKEIKDKKDFILYITWEPYLKKEPQKSILDRIASGYYDEYIKKMAISIKKYKKPVLLRWGHEPNGDWYSWSGFYNGKRTELYKKAWIRILDIIRKNGVDNVRLVFSVNGDDKPEESWNRFENYYPGDDYVDAVGLDIYNWGKTQNWSNWRSPVSAIKTPYARALKMAPFKPIFITEVGSCEKGGDKFEWFKSFLSKLQNRYTAVKGFMWFDYDKECDWRISGSNKLKKEYLDATKKEKYFSANPEILDWFFKRRSNGHNESGTNEKNR